VQRLLRVERDVGERLESRYLPRRLRVLRQGGDVQPVVEAGLRLSRPLLPNKVESNELPGGPNPVVRFCVPARRAVEVVEWPTLLEHLAALKRDLDGHRPILKPQGQVEGA